MLAACQFYNLSRPMESVGPRVQCWKSSWDPSHSCFKKIQDWSLKKQKGHLWLVDTIFREMWELVSSKQMRYKSSHFNVLFWRVCTVILKLKHLLDCNTTWPIFPFLSWPLFKEEERLVSLPPQHKDWEGSSPSRAHRRPLQLQTWDLPNSGTEASSTSKAGGMQIGYWMTTWLWRGCIRDWVDGEKASLF